ncbi:MAG: tetratricopeptide repeat protein [Planctomycetota bacterium]|nr:tetratricopeptide repeat protein [Planctomycetota bacterium]
MMMGKMPAKYRSVLIPIFLFSVTFGTFWPVLKHEFVKYDDDKYVTENPHITGGLTLQSVVWAFTTPHFFMWHPLTSLSHLLDYELYGLNPFGHHLTSLLIHIANVLLLFWVLKKLTGAVWPSAFVAAVFAVHPLQVESVAWVAERKNVLSAFFWMLTMAAYIRYTERLSIGRYSLVVLTFSLGLMAKPMVVTLPCVLLLLDYWPLQRLQWHRQSKGENSPQAGLAKVSHQQLSLWRLLGEKIPLFILTAVISAITYIIQQRGGTVAELETIPVSYRAANAVISYATYIEKMIWPSGLAVFYPYPGGGFSVVQMVASVALLVIISVCCIYPVRKKTLPFRRGENIIVRVGFKTPPELSNGVYFFGSRKYLATGWLWYLGVLVPVIGLVQAGAQARADRYMYIPMVGLLIMVVWGTDDLVAKWRCRGVTSVLLAVVIVSAAMVCASLQLKHWQDSAALFRHTLNVTRNNYVIQNNYANLLRDSGRVDEAIEHYTRCIEIRSDSPEVHNNLGNALAAKGRTVEAIVHYEKAIELVKSQKSSGRSLPVLAEAYYNLAEALRIQKRFQEAIEHYAEALKFKPNDVDALHGFGLTLAELNRFDEAVKCYRRMLELEPNNVIARGLLGLALAGQGKVDEAIEQLRIVLSRRPDDVEMYCNVGILLEQQDRTDEAIKEYRRALQINPAYDKARYLLDAALAKQDSRKTEKFER